MKINYSFSRLSRSERAFLEAVLLEEMDLQNWYAVTCTAVFGELLVVIQ